MPHCPNKQHPDYKSIEEVYGRDAAYHAYVKNGEDIPTITGAKYILGVNEDGERADLKTVELMRGLTGIHDPVMADAAVEHLMNVYPEVNFFSSSEAFANYVRTNFLREIDVSAEDIGLAFKNAIYIKPGEHLQDRLLHELGHIYYDSLTDDNKSKMALRKLFTIEGVNRPIEEVDEDVVRAIGQVAFSNAERFFSPSFYEKLKTALKKFWVQVKLNLGLASKKDLLFDMADQLYSNRLNIGKEIFGNDVLRHLLVPAQGNEVGIDFDHNGRHTTILSKKLLSPTAISRALFTQPSMDTIEGINEKKIADEVKRSYIGKAGGNPTTPEVVTRAFMQNQYYAIQSHIGTAIHAVMASYFADSSTLSAERIDELLDLENQAKALVGDAAYSRIQRICHETDILLRSRYGDNIKYHVELELASSSKGLFGRLDLIIEKPNGKFIVADFKSINESLFGEDGKTFSKKYTQVYGTMKTPKFRVNDQMTKTELFVLHSNLSAIPNTKFRQHQLQGLVYKTLVEDQKIDNSKRRPEVEEVIIIPLIKDLEPNVAKNTDGSLDRKNSKWTIRSIKLDKNVVVIYNAKLNGPSVPQNSSLNRERNIEQMMLSVIDKVKVVEMSQHSDVLEDNIRKAMARNDIGSVKIAYESINFVEMATGKSLNVINSRDVQGILNIGFNRMYIAAQDWIEEQAEQQKVSLPENFMAMLNHEQIYWASKRRYTPDFSDPSKASLSNTVKHADERMRFKKVEVGKEYSWKDNTSENNFDYKLHSGQLVKLSINGGSQEVLFKEYGLTEASKDGALKVGMNIMLPPIKSTPTDKVTKMDHTMLIGEITKVYNGSITVTVDGNNGEKINYYIKDKDNVGEEKGESIDVHATDDYGIYVVQSAAGVSYNINETNIDIAGVKKHTMDTWSPSYEETSEPVYEHHFLDSDHFRLVDGEMEFVNESTANSFKGLWMLFKTIPTNKDMIRLFSDTADDPAGEERNSFGKLNISDIEYAIALLVQRTMSDIDNENGPANDMISSLKEAMFCHVIADEIRKEASEPSETLPKWVMNLNNMAKNIGVNGGRMLSVSDLEVHIKNQTQFKMPRLIDAHHYGINIFKDMLAEAYNESQGSIYTNTTTYDQLVKKATAAGRDMKDIMYRQPSSKYVATAPYVFRSVKDESLAGKPELVAILEFLENLYQNTVPGFITIGGTLVPLADKKVSEVGHMFKFWRSRFVHLFSNKPWDSEILEYDPSGSLDGKNMERRSLKEWKRIFLEQNSNLQRPDNSYIGSYWQHVSFRWLNHYTTSYNTFSTSKLHLLDRMARTEYEKKYGKGKEAISNKKMLSSLIVQRSSSQQSLIPTQNIEVSLRTSIKNSITSKLMEKVNPMASYMYDSYVANDQVNSANFIYGQMAANHPSIRGKDDSPLARILRVGMYLTTMHLLVLNVGAQVVNVSVGQFNNFRHKPSAFFTGWHLLVRNPKKAMRLLKYYKVITITEDFVYDVDENDFMNKMMKIGLWPMQQVENCNHAVLVLGMLGKRVFDNLDEQMMDETNNGKSSGNPKRGLQYKINIPVHLKDEICEMLIANGTPKADTERTVKSVGGTVSDGFAWCSPFDLAIIANTLGSTVKELIDTAQMRRKNDYDLPSKAHINRILSSDIGQAQGDYRKTLRNAFSSTTVGAATMMFRKWYASVYSEHFMSSKRDSNYEMLVSSYDRIASDLWYYGIYKLLPHAGKSITGNKNTTNGLNNTMLRLQYLEKALNEMVGYDINSTQQSDLISLENKHAFKGRQIATVMLLTKLMDNVVNAADGELSLERMLTGQLSDEGKTKLDAIMLELAKNGGRSSNLYANRARNTVLSLLLALAGLVIFSPDDDEKDSSENTLFTQMPWWKRNLYIVSQGILMNNIGMFVLPKKMKNTYQASSIQGYITRVINGKKDLPWQQSMLEGMASTSEEHEMMDMVDRIIDNPITGGIYNSLNYVYNLFNDDNWNELKNHEASELAKKSIEKINQDVMLRLQEEDPERFNRIMEAKGNSKAALEEAYAAIWYAGTLQEKVDLDGFDYAMNKNNREQVTTEYETFLNNSKK